MDTIYDVQFMMLIPLNITFIFIIAVICSVYEYVIFIRKLNKIFKKCIKYLTLENEIPYFDRKRPITPTNDKRCKLVDDF